MRSRDVLGHKIMRVLRERDYTDGDHSRSGSLRVTDFVLDNGAVIVLQASETEDCPVPDASVVWPTKVTP